MDRQPHSAQPRYKAIAEDLQKQIARSCSGDFLEVETELAKRYNANVGTVRRALGLLAERGLIHRSQGRGTVVADRLATGHVAVVLSPALLGIGASPYYAKMISALIDKLHDANPRARLKLHLGRDVGSGDQYPHTLDLLDAGVLRDLRGVFTFHSLGQVEEQLRRNDVPVVELNVNQPNKFAVTMDRAGMLELAVDHLAETSSRGVGMIWARYGSSSVQMRDDHLLQRFMQRIEARQMATKMQWVQPHEGHPTEKAGYEAMMRLWARSQGLDAVVVLDDVMCWGALRAAMQAKIDIPNRLKLISFANKGVDFPYDKPLTRVEFDSQVMAEHAIRMLVDLVEGRISDHPGTMVQGRFVEGQTT